MSAQDAAEVGRRSLGRLASAEIARKLARESVPRLEHRHVESMSSLRHVELLAEGWCGGDLVPSGARARPPTPPARTEASLSSCLNLNRCVPGSPRWVHDDSIVSGLIDGSVLLLLVLPLLRLVLHLGLPLLHRRGPRNSRNRSEGTESRLRVGSKARSSPAKCEDSGDGGSPFLPTRIATDPPRDC